MTQTTWRTTRRMLAHMLRLWTAPLVIALPCFAPRASAGEGVVYGDAGTYVPAVSGATAIWSPPAAHRVIRAPVVGAVAVPGEGTAAEGVPHHPLHHARVAIPGAVIEPVWRQPYAYGYFGAAPHAHWQRHFGYHRAYTQWTLK